MCHAPENRLPREPALSGAQGLAATVVVAADAGKQKNPDNPAAAAAVASAAAKESVSAAAVAVAAEAGEQKDNPDDAAAVAPENIVVAGAGTIVGASTVSSGQIAHFFASEGFIYGLFYAGWHVNVS